MFHVFDFYHPESVAEHIVGVLTKFDYYQETKYLMTTSISFDYMESPTSLDIHGMYYPLIDQLRDLDSLEGIFKIEADHGTTIFDFDNSDAALDKMYINLFEGKKQSVIHAGSGLSLIFNDFATAPTQFPFIVVKKMLVDCMKDAVVESLKFSKPDEDYTGRVTPGIYIEIDEIFPHEHGE